MRIGQEAGIGELAGVRQRNGQKSGLVEARDDRCNAGSAGSRSSTREPTVV